MTTSSPLYLSLEELEPAFSTVIDKIPFLCLRRGSH